MIYCGHCGHPNQEGAMFCGSCGKPLPRNSGRNDTEDRKKHATKGKSGGSWIDSLNEYVGNDKPADLNWKVLFSDVFKPHTTEEAEEIFIYECPQISN